MKSMWPPLAAIFFMTYLYRAGGGGPWPPRHPLDPLLEFSFFTKDVFSKLLLQRLLFPEHLLCLHAHAKMVPNQNGIKMEPKPSSNQEAEPR